MKTTFFSAFALRDFRHHIRQLAKENQKRVRWMRGFGGLIK